MTNFERITKSPEELGEFLFTFRLNGCQEFGLGLWEAREDGLCAKGIPCKECLAQWLKQETEKGNEQTTSKEHEMPEFDNLEFDNLGVHKVMADMEYKFEIGAIIALLRKLLTATWDYNIAHRRHIGVMVEDVLNFLIDAMEEKLEKEEKETEK